MEQSINACRRIVSGRSATATAERLQWSDARGRREQLGGSARVMCAGNATGVGTDLQRDVMLVWVEQGKRRVVAGEGRDICVAHGRSDNNASPRRPRCG